MEFQTSSQSQKESLLRLILEAIAGILILAIFFMLVYYGNSITKILKGMTSLNNEAMSKKQAAPEITLPKVLYNLAGTLELLGKNSLIFEASIVQLDEQKQVTYKKEVRKALVTPATKFSRLSFVSQEGQEQKTPRETTITFSDLRIKDYIEVISNQDISQVPEFTATQVRVLPK